MERPQGYLPDFVFPLQKALAQALEEIPVLQQEFREEVRPEVRKAIQFLMEDPEAQVLMDQILPLQIMEEQVVTACLIVFLVHQLHMLEVAEDATIAVLQMFLVALVAVALEQVTAITLQQKTAQTV